MSARELDVTVEMTMEAPAELVAAIMFDAERDPQWMAAVRGVERLPDATQVRRFGRFMGKTIAWVTQTLAREPLRLRLAIIDGPFQGTVSYDILPDANGARVRIRNTGQPGAFRFMPRWVIAAMMRKALRADLERLRRLVEAKD